MIQEAVRPQLIKQNLHFTLVFTRENPPGALPIHAVISEVPTVDERVSLHRLALVDHRSGRRHFRDHGRHGRIPDLA